jgi:ABC-type Mn2+/Zn2+ transport system ATPase subunit
VHDVIRIKHNDPNGVVSRALLELTGTQPLQELSGGQRQRIAV